jgi:hypothetical protein
LQARINIRSLKRFAQEYLPRSCALRDVLLAEREELDAEEFLAKLETWLMLTRQL